MAALRIPKNCISRMASRPPLAGIEAQGLEAGRARTSLRRKGPEMKSLTRGLIAGIAMIAWAERSAANESVVAGIGGRQAFDQATLSLRADEIEDEWTATVGAATARQWREYLDQLPPPIADAFVAWWQAHGRAQLQQGAWQNRFPDANDARSRTERLAAIERWIDANYPGGLRAFDAEVVRCYGDVGMHLLVLLQPFDPRPRSNFGSPGGRTTRASTADRQDRAAAI